MNKQHEWTAIILILLLTAGLRFWGLGQVPPGLAHDEVANWLIARDILSGNHAIYFTAAYGHEPLYQYVQAATVALFGDHWLGLRWPSVAFGLLGIAAPYILIRRLFGPPMALLSAAWLAVSFWPLFYARVALRAISLPFTAALSAYFLFRACDQSTHPKSVPIYPPEGCTNAILTGLFLGLSLYTYMAARVLPFIFATYLIYLYLLSRAPALLRPCTSAPLPLRSFVLLFLAAALIAAPLVIWLATHPGAESRIAEVREPLDRLLAGDPAMVWQNLIANLKFFTVAGDPWPRQNIPDRPIFADPVSAGLFYVGLLIALWRWRDPRYGFLLIWLLGSLGPSVVTAVAPSSIRDILGLVVTFAFPALALVEIEDWFKQKIYSKHDCHHSPPTSYFLLPILIAPCLFLTVRDYFARWPQNETVRFVYQADLTAVGHQVDRLPAQTPVTVAGLSVHTLDGPSLELSTRRDVDNVRLCDTRETLVIPDATGRDAWLFVPKVIPFDEDLRHRLLNWEATEVKAPAFTGYRLSENIAPRHLETTVTLPDGDPVGLPASFDGQLAFLGYEQSRQEENLMLMTYWRVEYPPSSRLKIFVHLVGESGKTVIQDDGLGSPPQGWKVGDFIVQKHVLPLFSELTDDLYTLQVGLYNEFSGLRLHTLGTDRLILAPVDTHKP